MQAIEDRVEVLASVLGQFIVHTDVALNRLEKGMSDFRKEMSDFKKEMSDFKKEMREDRKEMNKQWAALANKMGNLDEDLVVPATRPVLGKYFNCKPVTRTIRVLRRMDDEEFEVDVLVVGDDKVFMIEVKSSPRTEHVDQILEKAGQFKKFFPEYKDKELIPIYASIVFPENVIKYATKKALYVMAYREWEYMDIINFDEVSKKG